MDFYHIQGNILFAAEAGRFDTTRLSVCRDRDDNLFVIVNIHYLDKINAKKIINNTIGAVPRGIGFTVEVIHGYHHGTELKRFINQDLVNDRIIDRRPVDYDEGITFLKVA